MKKKSLFLFAAVTLSTLVGCKGGNTPTPKPDPKPESTTVSIAVVSAHATFGDNQQWYVADKVDKKTAFSIDFTPASGYKLSKECFEVYIGKSETPYTDSFTFSNNKFTINPEYVVNDMVITCSAAIDPVDPPEPEPTETYAVNLQMGHVNPLENYKGETISSIKSGESLIAYISIDNSSKEKYRLPNPELAKQGSYKDNVEVRIKERLLDSSSDYLYKINKDSETNEEYALIVIPYDRIDGPVNIIGAPIQQLMVHFYPHQKDGEKDGHWSDNTVEPRKARVDEGSTLDDAFKELYLDSPIPNKKSEGYRYKNWRNESGNDVYGSYVPTVSDEKFYAHFEQASCNVYFDAIGLKKPEEKEWEYGKEISYTLEAQTGYKLPNSIEVWKDDFVTGKHEKMVPGTNYSYNRETGNFTILKESATGNFTVTITCAKAFTVTFDANGGTFPGKTGQSFSVVVGQGDTLADAKNLADLAEQSKQPTKDSLTFDYWYIDNGGTEMPINDSYVFTANTELKAKYNDLSFKNVSWEQLCKDTTELTFEQLKNKYKASLVDDSFVTLERTVNYECDYGSFGGKMVRQVGVRVIGENHDDLSDGSGKAKLTFQFTEIVKKDATYCYQPEKYKDSNEYEYSNLRNELVSAKDNLESRNEGLTVKPVKKTTLKGGPNDDHVNYVYLDEYLFALSGAEIGITTEAPRKKMNEDTVKFYDTNPTIQIVEGTAYDYYKFSSLTPELRVMKWYKDKVEEGDPHYLEASYFLRTPHAYKYSDRTSGKDTSAAYIIYGTTDKTWQDGNGHYDRTIGSAGIAPAFCI